MRISKWRWNSLCERVDRCEKELKRQRDENKEMLLAATKRILREPEKLSEELEELEKIDQMLEEFIRS